MRRPSQVKMVTGLLVHSERVDAMIVRRNGSGRCVSMDYEVTQDDGSSEQRTLTRGRANGRRWLTTSRLQNAEITDLDDVKR